MVRYAAELIDVEVVYPTPAGEVRALDRVTCGFQSGTSTALQGRSGSGKSTLISVLALLRRPTAGRVLVRGRDVAGVGERGLARLRGGGVGVVFQSFHLDHRATAAENVCLPWAFSVGAMRRKAAFARAEALLAQLGVAELAGRTPSEMSGGQRQRVAIARALFNDPALLIADEPTGNLDEETAAAVAADLYALPETMGTTVIVVTHDSCVAALADRTLHLVSGRITHENGVPR